MQTKRHSVFEAIVGTAIGYVVALASQLAVFPLFGIHVPIRSNLLIGLWFTGISIGRGYLVRRWFTKRTEA